MEKKFDFSGRGKWPLVNFNVLGVLNKSFRKSFNELGQCKRSYVLYSDKVDAKATSKTGIL